MRASPLRRLSLANSFKMEIEPKQPGIGLVRTNAGRGAGEGAQSQPPTGTWGAKHTYLVNYTAERGPAEGKRDKYCLVVPLWLANRLTWGQSEMFRAPMRSGDAGRRFLYGFAFAIHARSSHGWRARF